MEQNKEVEFLKKALDRQKQARKQAEQILEEKSKELYDVNIHLKSVNERLERLMRERSSDFDGVFINVIDPYVVMDMHFNVIEMNTSAKEFLGYDYSKEPLNLSKLVHKDYIEYTAKSFKTLMQVGLLKNYRAKIKVKDGSEKMVQINSSLIYNKEGKPIAAQGILRDITREEEIKLLLAEQKRHLDIMVDNSPLGVVLTERNKIIKVNQAFCKLMGYSQTELKKQKVDQVTLPKYHQKMHQYFVKMDKGKLNRFTVVIEYKKKDGSTFFAKTTVNAFRDTQDHLEYQVAMIEDISKEMEAQKQLRESESRLATLISNLNTAVLLEDEKGVVTLANKMYCDTFSLAYGAEDLKGRKGGELAQMNKRWFKRPKTYITQVNRIAKQRQPMQKDELELRDGRILERDYIPIFSNNQYKGHLWTYDDVTIRKNYKINLEIEKEKYKDILNTMNLGLLEINTQGEIQFVNKSFCSMSGYAQKELVGQKIRQFLGQENGAQVMNAHEQSSASFEISVSDKFGAERYWLVSVAPLHNERGGISGSIIIQLDITDQKVLEIQKENLLNDLEESNKNLEEYAHIVSHDLKSPLRSINALATWIGDDFRDKIDEMGRENLKLLQEKVELMDKLIDGILKYSTASKKAADNSKVNLNAVIKEITDIIYIPDHVEVVVANPLPTVYADRTKMHQLFQNFLSNAVVHIENPKGLVEVSCQEVGNHWQFAVKDNGVGIPKEYHEKIFKIFQSAGSKERSTGIGLSIVKKIVELYEGTVWLESEVGKGTTFYFTIKKQT